MMDKKNDNLKQALAKKPQTIDGLEITENDDGFGVFDPVNEKVHFVNSSGVIILELCNGKNTVEEIIRTISTSFGLSQMPEKEVKGYIDHLAREGLIV